MPLVLYLVRNALSLKERTNRVRKICVPMYERSWCYHGVIIDLTTNASEGVSIKNMYEEHTNSLLSGRVNVWVQSLE